MRRVAKLRRNVMVAAALYALAAAVFTALGGIFVFVGFLFFFALWGLPALAHYQRVAEPSSQTSSGTLLDGTLMVDGDEILIDGYYDALRATPAHIADGWIEPFAGGQHRVVIRLHSGDLGVVEVDGLQRGHAILSAIGLSADKQALRVRTSGNDNQLLREMGFLSSLFCLCIPLLWIGFAEDTDTILGLVAASAGVAAVAGLFARSLVKPVARVGLDGVEITRGRRKRFIPVKDIEGAHLTVTGVELEVRQPRGPGELVLLRCWGVQQAALLARIQEVVRGFGSSTASATQLAQLDRHGRDLRTWTEALRRVAADDAGDYRRIGLARDDLARLLAQGDQPPERRIAAAIALASSGDPVERERVRVAARACASEDLRAALDKIAEDEADEALVDAALHEPMRMNARRTDS